MKEALTFHFEWTLEYLLISIAGFALVASMYIVTRQILFEKHRSLGYQLFKQKISYRKAFWKAVFATIKYPLVLSGVTAMLLANRGHALDGFVIVSFLTIPPCLISIEKMLKELEKKAEKDYGEE